ncbi:hypothetical protein DASC09_041550 [Saccharomycopsis crataegensis]|uniref:Uncharacterized protein n=1 Tax=Saccharomycopsis crataegensis TaxID=43959 RepID=A0AAV5QRC5_9ASCO|nr:hypothetical protein DASC09_041550 [Saccharomycopsis crataegensis]
MEKLRKFPPELLRHIFKYCQKCWLVQLRNLVVDDHQSTLSECIDSILFDRIAIIDHFRELSQYKFKNLPFYVLDPRLVPDSLNLDSCDEDIISWGDIIALDRNSIQDIYAVDNASKYVREFYFFQEPGDIYSSAEVKCCVDFINSARGLELIHTTSAIPGIVAPVKIMEIPPNAAEKMLPNVLSSLESLSFLEPTDKNKRDSDSCNLKYHFPRLKKLQLVDFVRDFDGSKWKLSNLEELEVWFSDEGSVSNMDSLYFPNLEKLEIGRCISKSIQINSLLRLVIREAGICEEIFESLPNLKTLILEGNELTEIPNLECLKNLEVLEISDNPGITKVNSLHSLPKLISLDLSRNSIQYINLDSSKFPKLETLYISHNKLTCMNEFNNIPSLIKLYANNNRINDIVSLNYPKLRHLNVSHNSIWALRDIKNVPSLVELDVSYNYIEDISYLHLPSMKVLILRSNCVCDVSSLRSLHTLEHLDLSSNLFKSFHQLEAIGYLSKLKHLELGSTSISEMETLNVCYLPASAKIEIYNASLRSKFDILFRNNKGLIISCHLGTGSKDQLFSNLTKDYC